MNTNQYLDEAFYRNISTSEDKTFDFADGKSIKYRTAVNGMSDVSLQVKTGQFVPFEKQYINPKSTAPYLVKLKVDSDAITPFSLLKEALQRNLGTVVDCWYENMAYLNTDENVFKQLQTLPMMVSSNSCSVSRCATLFSIMDKILVSSIYCKRWTKFKNASVNLWAENPKVPKLNIEAAQAIQGTIPTDIPLPDLGNVEAFLTSN